MQDREDVRFPEEWSLEVEQSGQWKPFELYTTDRYERRANQYNVVHPAAPLKCDAIRIRMTPKEDACVGILEAQVAFESNHAPMASCHLNVVAGMTHTFRSLVLVVCVFLTAF